MTMEPDFYESRKASRKRSEAPGNGELFPEAPTITRTRRVPAQSGSDTSVDAARRIAPKAEAMRANIYRAIVAAGTDGVTRKELESITGYLTQTLCARLYELEESKDIRKLTYISEPQRTIATIKRDACAVYVANRRVV